ADIRTHRPHPIGKLQTVHRTGHIYVGEQDIDIIITSGMVRLDPMALPANTAFLPKPYMQDTLISTIDTLMT
ncbi:hypothetical protein ACC695_41100, partial [Rhizobium ruizarguesonis]